MRPPPRAPSLALLRNRNFALLWSGQSVSLLGDKAHQIALPVLVFQLTESPLQVGLIFAAVGLPWLLLGSVAGALVDRWDRRRTMATADLLRAGLVALVPAAAGVDISLVYALAFLISTISVFFIPARLASIPDIVDPDRLLAANSLFQISDALVDVIGLLLAAVLVATLGVVAPFYLDAISFAVSGGFILAMSFSPSSREWEPLGLRRLWEELIEGFRFVASNTYLAANTFLFTLGPLASGATTAMTAVYAIEVLQAGAPGFALMEASMSLGFVAGGLAIGRFAARYQKGPIILAGFALFGITLLGIGLTDRLVIALMLVAVNGIANMLFYIPSVTLVQEVTPADLRGRAFGLRSALIQGAFLVSVSAGGAFAEVAGVASIFVLAGGLVLIVGLLGWLVPSLREAD